MGLYNTATGENDLDYLSKQNGNKTNIPQGPYGSRVSVPTSFGQGLSQEDYEDLDGFLGSVALLDKYKIDTQSNFARARNTVFGGILSGMGTFLETAGYITDLNSWRAVIDDMDTDDRFSSFISMFPNSLFAKGLQKLGKGIKNWTEESMPIYERESSAIFDNVMSFKSLKSVVDSAVGFTLTGLGAGAVVKFGLKTLGSMAGQAGRWAESFKLFNGLKNSSKLVQGLEDMSYKLARTEAFGEWLSKARMPKTMQFLQSQAAGFTTKVGEGMVEGVETYESTLNMLDPLVRSGKLTRKQAEEKAEEAANHAFDMTKWTWALDAFMLQDLFKPAISMGERVIKPTFKSMAKEVGKKALLGAPKEGFEESWQEAAKMEGMTRVYNQVQHILDYDEDLAVRKNMGFNPTNLPESFLGRTVHFMSSKQGQIAGWIGALSGPLQSGAIETYSVIKNKKSDQERYEAQQRIIKENEQTFGAANGLATKIKKLTMNAELKNLAAKIGDKDLEEYSADLIFLNEAEANYKAGTVNDLIEVLDKNPGERSTRFKNLLKEYHDDLAKVSKYANAEDVMTLTQNIKFSKKLADLYNQKSTDQSLPETERKQYADAATSALKKVDDFRKLLDEITATKFQVNLFSQEEKTARVKEVLGSLNSINDISTLQGLYQQYNHPAIQERINELKKQSKTSQAVPVAENVSVVDNTSLPKEPLNVQPGDKFHHSKGKILTIKDIKRNDEGLITDLIFEETKANGEPQKISNPSGFGDDYLRNSIKKVVPESKLDRSQFESLLKSKFDQANKANNINISYSEKDVDHFINIYNEEHNKGLSLEEADQNTNIRAAKEIYLPYVTGTKKSDEDIEEVQTELKDLATSIVNVAAQLNLSHGDKPVDVVGIDDEFIKEAFDPDMSNAKLREMLQQFAYRLAKVANTLNLPMDSLQAFIKTIQTHAIPEEVDADIVKDYRIYNELKAVYALLTKQDESQFPNTYEELFTLPVDINSIQEDDYESSTSRGLVEAEEEVDLSNADPVTVTHRLYQDHGIPDKIKKSRHGVESFAYVEDTSILLDPEQFNAGDPISLSIDLEYNGRVKLPTGSYVMWKDMLEANNSGNWKSFINKHKLDPDSSIYDYYPIKIVSSNNENISYVHIISWIDKMHISGTPALIENNKKVMKAFRRRLVPFLLKNKDNKVSTKIEKKAIDVSNANGPIGFQLNLSTSEQPTHIQLPDNSLKFGGFRGGQLQVPGNSKIGENAINSSKFPKKDFVGVVFLPLGKVGGKMKYWMQALLNTKIGTKDSKGKFVPNDLTRGLRQAVEIFVKQNKDINTELYRYYEKNGIDLLNPKGLRKALEQVLLVRFASHDMEAELGNNRERAIIKVVEGEHGYVSFGYSGPSVKTGVMQLYKNSQDSVVDDYLDMLETQVLPNMLFNVNTSFMNNSKPHIVGLVNADGNFVENTSSYNQLLKQYSKTKAKGTKLKNGNYSYTKLNIVTFDVTDVLNKIPAEVNPVTKLTEQESIPDSQKKEISDTVLNELEENSKFIVLDKTRNVYINMHETRKSKELVEALHKGDYFFGANGLIYTITDVDSSGKPLRAKDSSGNSVPVETAYTRVYKRVSQALGKASNEKGQALDFGTKVDEFLRDYFSGSLKELSKYSFASSEVLDIFINQLQAIELRGERIVAKNLIVFNEELGIAGELDMITQDSDGALHIYDFKTMKGNHFTEHYYGETETTEDKDKQAAGTNIISMFYKNKFGESKAEGYSKQLSLYNILLSNTHGFSASDINVIPVEINYSENESVLSNINLLPSVQLDMKTDVNGIKLSIPRRPLSKRATVEQLFVEPKTEEDLIDERLNNYVTEKNSLEDLKSEWKSAKIKLSLDQFIAVLEHRKKNSKDSGNNCN